MKNNIFRIIKKDTPKLTTANIEKDLGGRKGRINDNSSNTAAMPFTK